MTTNPQSVLTKSRILKLQQKIDEYKKEILELQKHCLHDFKKVWTQISTDQFQFRVTAYKCAICGAGKERESETTHCYICDGKMEDAGYIPGQGGGIHLERCTECGRNSPSDYYGWYQSSIPKEDFIVFNK